MFDPQAYAMWESWNNLKGMPRRQAMESVPVVLSGRKASVSRRRSSLSSRAEREAILQAEAETTTTSESLVFILDTHQCCWTKTI